MIKNLLRFALLIALLAPAKGLCGDFHLIELDELRVDYISFFPGSRDPLITSNGLPDRQLGKMLDVSISTTVFKYGYWRSLVHSYTDSYASTNADGQFRSVGLNMELGVRLTPFLDVFAWHYSQHLLDTSPTVFGNFPVQDGIGIHLYIYSRDRKESLINIK